jgi:DNA helicase-2/ATP-dependent DNA helicase PcrA
MMEPSYLDALNPQQRDAVFHTGKPLLILAGAGSGKTRVITTKIAYLIREKNCPPKSILAVTFTNKAAKEMASRAARIDPRAGDSMLRTFHSFGAYFLHCYGDYAGLNSNFVIYDDADMITLLKSLMPGEKKDAAKITAHLISRAKDYCYDPDSPQLDLINHTKKFRALYQSYEDRLRQMGNVDFGDLIKKPVEILRANPDLAERIHDRFRVIMVDEYQDANVAQAALLQELFSPQTYLCVVGDDDQSIYRFRGAEVRNILKFPDQFGGADIVRLEQNYRSTKYILDIADSVVKRNEGRLGKKLVSERGDGIMPHLEFLSSQDEEVAFCINLIKKSMLHPGAQFSDWAILYRTNAQSMGFENEFLRRNIPYRIVGSLKFYEREEIKDTIALLSFMVNPKDEISFRRVVNKPTRGVGAASVDRILDERTAAQNWNIEEVVKIVLPALTNNTKKGLEEFFSAIERGRASLDKDASKPGKSALIQAAEGLAICIANVIIASKIDQHHIAHDEIAGDQRVANLQELVNAASLYPATEQGLLEFLEHIELDRSIEQNTENDDRVTLITIHNTKGLEFKRVVITGMENGLFPRYGSKGDDLEEERRLFYVGATRAMDELYLTSCAQRRMYGQTQFSAPSQFLEEVDKTNLYIHGATLHQFKSAQSRQRSIELSDSHEQSALKPSGKRKTSSDGRWQVGDRIFHEDSGYGEVAGIKESDDGPVIKVQFESGQSRQFLSAVQSARFMKIKGE